MLKLWITDHRILELIKTCGIINLASSFPWCKNWGIEKLNIYSTLMTIRMESGQVSFCIICTDFSRVTEIHSVIPLPKHLLNSSYVTSVVPSASNTTINKIQMLLSQNSLFHLSEERCKLIPFSTPKGKFHNRLIQ